MENTTAAQHEAESVSKVKYSRAQALAEGVMIDISELAKMSGINLPTAMTVDLFSTYFYLDNPDDESEVTKVEERFNAMLGAFFDKLTNDESAGQSSMIELDVRFDEDHPPIQARLHGGDDGEAVMTFMFPIER